MLALSRRNNLGQKWAKESHGKRTLWIIQYGIFMSIDVDDCGTISVILSVLYCSHQLPTYWLSIHFPILAILRPRSRNFYGRHLIKSSFINDDVLLAHENI